MFDKLNSLWLWKFNFKLQNCAEKYFKLQNCAARVLQIFARHLKLVKNAKKFFHSKPAGEENSLCLLYTSPSPRDGLLSRMPSSA